MYLPKSNSKKTWKKNFFIVGILSATDEKSMIRIRSQTGIRIRIRKSVVRDPRAWIRTKMSWIHNTAGSKCKQRTIYVSLAIISIQCFRSEMNISHLCQIFGNLSVDVHPFNVKPHSVMFIKSEKNNRYSQGLMVRTCQLPIPKV